MDEQSKTDAVETTDSGLTPSTILGGCDNAQNGVSVENMPLRKEGYAWFVFRASYGREDKAADLLKSLHTDTYVARHTVYVKKKTGGVKSVVKKLLPNLIFAYLTKEESRLFTKGPESHGMLFTNRTRADQILIAELSAIISYYYNHFETDDFGKNPPLTIPYRQMQDFVIATCTERDVMPVDDRLFQKGDEVEVIMGEFKGLRGRVIRQQRNKQRLLFQLPCLGSFSSALIPTAYFRKIEETDETK